MNRSDDPASNLSFPGLESLDPALFDVVEEYTRRLLSGDDVDLDVLLAEHPEWAGTIKSLLPTMQGLADLGQVEPGPRPEEGRGGESPGEWYFGNFRVIREVGRGGMGIVYEAEQVELKRRVALKILPLAAAMDSRALQRFQLEAQVAGWLQHPRIVPVHAVGVVDELPFYAMQLVEGGSLASLIAELRGLVGLAEESAPQSEAGALAVGLLSGRFAPPQRESDSAHHVSGPAPVASRPGPSAPLSIRGRSYLRTIARLGIQAAEALGYAHDQGVIHRDVKPANLLLDRQGDLWVADFGMADVQGSAELTRTGDLPGTLRYMSPEQALGRRALVDRRTDLYSLGATLHELLTLQPAVSGADHQEVLRRIAEEEPTPVRRLNPAVPVDLATIVAKLMAKDPSNRYETAWLLAEDLGRFLDGVPIVARPVGPLTRAWRWCRRKPIQAGLAGALVLALGIGIGGITWNWREAERQKGLLVVAEKEARSQAARADAINRFLIDRLLAQAEPANNPAANRVTLLEVLDRAADGVGASFADQPEIEATLRLAIGRIYHGLGEYAKSEAHERLALTRFGPVAAGQGQGAGRLEAKSELGHMLSHLGRWDEAEPLLLQAVDQSRRELGASHTTTLRASEYLADVHRMTGRNADAESLYRRYLADARRAPKPDQDIIFSALFNLGDVLLRERRPVEGEALYRELLSDQRRLKGPRHPDTLSTMNNLGAVLQKQEKYGEAEQLFRQCAAIDRDVFGPKHPQTATVVYNLGHVLNKQGRFAEAEALMREAVEARKSGVGPDHPATLYAISGLASVLRSQGKLDEAEALLRPCLEAQTRILGARHPETVRTQEFLDKVADDRSRRGSTITPDVAKH